MFPSDSGSKVPRARFAQINSTVADYIKKALVTGDGGASPQSTQLKRIRIPSVASRRWLPNKED